ncbi:MAG: DUF2784 domain-containing protein [Planctomycetota bacterium]
MYAFWADVILMLHFAIVAGVVLGFAAIGVGSYLRRDWVRNFYFRASHVLVMGVVTVQSLLNIPCPLTVWEMGLRDLADEGGVYSESFVEHWVGKILYSLPPGAVVLIYCLLLVALVASWCFVPPRWPWRHASANTRAEERADDTEPKAAADLPERPSEGTHE